MIVRMFACAALIACTAPALAQRNPPPLETPAGKAFVHANSGITLPARLAGLERTGAREYAAPQLDVLFTYTDPSEEEELSVYVYRMATGAPAVWFEEAIRSMGDRPAFRRMTDIELPVAFVPPRQTTASGMRAAWKIADSRMLGTALAIVPVGEWLVKFRYSSRKHEVAALVQRLDTMIAGLGWPAAMPVKPAATRIGDCPTPLKLDGASKPLDDDAVTVQLDARTVAGMAHEPELAQWCRDRQATATGPIYRPTGSDDSYLLPLSDSGQAVWVRPPLWEPLDDGKGRWAVSIVRAGEMLSYNSRDRLPPPAQIDEIVQDAPVSHLVTWGQIRELKPPLPSAK